MDLGQYLQVQGYLSYLILKWNEKKRDRKK